VDGSGVRSEFLMLVSSLYRESRETVADCEVEEDETAAEAAAVSCLRIAIEFLMF
jgi:hypothetical protein